MKKAIITAGLAAALLTFSACGAQPSAAPPAVQSSSQQETASESYQTDVFAMDTYMTFLANGDDAEAAVGAAVEKVQQLEKALSAVDESSEVAKINEGSGSAVAVSDETFAIVEKAMAVAQETDGAFDITVYPAVRAWGFTTESYHVPDQSTIDSLLPLVGPEHVQLDAASDSVRLTKGTQIDLGGIAKGYAGREAANLMREMGIKSALLNMGGNVQTIGSKTDGSPWRVAIRDPENEAEYAGYVDVADKAVVTSGGYERFFEENGHTYHHIIDPATGYPADNGILSTTVVGDDGELCDAYSTTLFVMGPEKARAFLEQHKEIGAIIITKDKGVYVSPGLTEQFTALGSYHIEA